MGLPPRAAPAALALALVLVAGGAGAAPGLERSGYDEALCATAQRIIVNAPAAPVRVQRGVGNGFYSIQMSVDAAVGELVVAMTTVEARDADGAFPAWVACKMVDQQRARDQLGLAVEGPPRSCRAVNEHTLAVAWNTLSDAERRRFEASGRTLAFADDVVVPTGGEWLPADAADYVGTAAAGIEVRAPTVRVPWDPDQRGFFQGTQHCKLVTLASMQRWLRDAAFRADAPLWPAPQAACRGPATLGSAVGSCLFYFAPVDAMVCQDYSGTRWTAAAARAECGRRHASRAALTAADNRYEGAGGRFDAADCAARADAPARAGTCVFRCGAPDETLWHLPGAMTNAGGGMLAKACDLFVPAGGESDIGRTPDAVSKHRD